MSTWNKPTIALVADEFTTYSLTPDADVIRLTPNNWRWKLRWHKPDYLLVESAWRGHGDSWRGKIASYPHTQDKEELKQLVDFCRQRGIPTIFWNKEDPFHFQRFADAAALFDLVYTTDSRCIERYQRLPHQRFRHVGLLMFAAQPAHYHAMSTPATSPLAFMGGYYGNELADRSRQQDDILSALSDKSLVIYDRFWTRGKQSSYPEHIRPFCRPAISNREIPSLCHQYEVQLNFNTIQDSPTMLSRRIIELACAGCVVISTPSLAMERIFGDSIAVAKDGASARALYEELHNNKKQQSDIRNAVRRVVLEEHTWRHRLEQLKRDLLSF